jgi:hypothetical protein
MREFARLEACLVSKDSKFETYFAWVAKLSGQALTKAVIADALMEASREDS